MALEVTGRMVDIQGSAGFLYYCPYVHSSLLLRLQNIHSINYKKNSQKIIKYLKY